MKSMVSILVEGMGSLTPLFAVVGANALRMHVKKSKYENERKAGYLLAGCLLCIAYYQWTSSLGAVISVGVLLFGMILLVMSIFFASRIAKEKQPTVGDLKQLIKTQYIKAGYLLEKTKALTEEEVDQITELVFEKVHASSKEHDEVDDEVVDQIKQYTEDQINKLLMGREDSNNGYNNRNI